MEAVWVRKHADSYNCWIIWSTPCSGEGSASSTVAEQKSAGGAECPVCTPAEQLWFDCSQRDRWLPSVIWLRSLEKAAYTSVSTLQRRQICWLLNHMGEKDWMTQKTEAERDRLCSKCQTIRKRKHCCSTTRRDSERDTRGTLFFGLCVWSNMRDMRKGRRQPTNMGPCREAFWCDKHNLVDSCLAGSKTGLYCLSIKQTVNYESGTALRHTQTAKSERQIIHDASGLINNKRWRFYEKKVTYIQQQRSMQGQTYSLNCAQDF